MTLHFRSGDIEVKKGDYIFTNGNSWSFGMKGELDERFPFSDYHRHQIIISKVRFEHLKKENYIALVQKGYKKKNGAIDNLDCEYWIFTEKAIISKEVI